MLIANGPILQVMTGIFYAVVIDKEYLHLESPEKLTEDLNEECVPIIRVFVDPSDALRHASRLQRESPHLQLEASSFMIDDFFTCQEAWGARVEICRLNARGNVVFLDLLYDPLYPLN